MYEIGQGGACMHHLKAGEYTYLAGEINSLYHEAAVKMGVSDSVMNILYVVCEMGLCILSKVRVEIQLFAYPKRDGNFHRKRSTHYLKLRIKSGMNGRQKNNCST